MTAIPEVLFVCGRNGCCTASTWSWHIATRVQALLDELDLS